jgi:hypothetical protein
MTYSGWIRKPRKHWVEVCRHETEAGCWKLLLAKKVAGDCERRVTPTGAPPAGATKTPAPPGLFDQEGRR